MVLARKWPFLVFVLKETERHWSHRIGCLQEPPKVKTLQISQENQQLPGEN